MPSCCHRVLPCNHPDTICAHTHYFFALLEEKKFFLSFSVSHAAVVILLLGSAICQRKEALLLQSWLWSATIPPPLVWALNYSSTAWPWGALQQLKALQNPGLCTDAAELTCVILISGAWNFILEAQGCEQRVIAAGVLCQLQLWADNKGEEGGSPESPGGGWSGRESSELIISLLIDPSQWMQNPEQGSTWSAIKWMVENDHFLVDVFCVPLDMFSKDCCLLSTWCALSSW